MGKTKKTSSLIEIEYIDDDIVVINKPAGVAAHASTGFNGDDVFSLLKSSGIEIKTSGDEYRQGIVSRLDVGTTGLMVLARNEQAFESLKEQFKEHLVEKVYLAVAEGSFKTTSGVIKAPIGRHPSPKKRALFAVVEDGKTAITNFKVLGEESFGNDKITLLEVKIETGRTHQIRVHLSAYSHPLLGDKQYGSKINSELKRPALHSAKLSFKHPRTAQEMSFNCAVPQDLEIFFKAPHLTSKTA